MDVLCIMCRAAKHGDFLAIYKSDHTRSDATGQAMLSTASTRRLGGSTGTVSEPSGHSVVTAGDASSHSVIDTMTIERQAVTRSSSAAFLLRGHILGLEVSSCAGGMTAKTSLKTPCKASSEASPKSKNQ